MRTSWWCWVPSATLTSKRRSLASTMTPTTYSMASTRYSPSWMTMNIDSSTRLLHNGHGLQSRLGCRTHRADHRGFRQEETQAFPESLPEALLEFVEANEGVRQWERLALPSVAWRPWRPGLLWDAPVQPSHGYAREPRLSRLHGVRHWLNNRSSSRISGSEGLFRFTRR